MRSFLTSNWLMLVFLMLAAFLLAGCSSFDPKLLENRVVCTVARDEAHTLSKYGPIGIGSKIAAADASVICAPPALAPAAAASAPK